MSSTLTKKAIASALKELLLEKPLNKITVNDVAEKCGINRQTFYYHFADLPDLIQWITLEDSDEAIKNNRTASTWQQGFLQVLLLIKKDHLFVENIYHSIDISILNTYLYRMTLPLLMNVVKEKVTLNHAIVSQEECEFIARFYTHAFVGIVIDWIKRGLKEDPKAIVDQVDSLISGSIDKSLNKYRRN